MDRDPWSRLPGLAVVLAVNIVVILLAQGWK